MRKRFKKILTSDINLSKIQDNVAESFKGLDELPQLDSNLVTEIFLDSTKDNVVSHGLNRPIIGWQVIDKNANANIWKSTTVNNSPSSVFLAKTSVSCTASFLFF